MAPTSTPRVNSTIAFLRSPVSPTIWCVLICMPIGQHPGYEVTDTPIPSKWHTYLDDFRHRLCTHTFPMHTSSAVLHVHTFGLMSSKRGGNQVLNSFKISFMSILIRGCASFAVRSLKTWRHSRIFMWTRIIVAVRCGSTSRAICGASPHVRANAYAWPASSIRETSQGIISIFQPYG